MSKKCPNCGYENDGYSKGCMSCGYKFVSDSEQRRRNREKISKNQSSIDGLAFILGFFLPFIGFIAWIVWMPTNPELSKSAGLGVIAGTILGISLYLFFVVIFAF